MGACRFQIEIDYRETAFVTEFFHDVENLVGNVVYAREGIFMTLLDIQVCKRAAHLACRDVGPADKAHIVVEEEIALCLAFAHKKSRKGLGTNLVHK